MFFRSEAEYETPSLNIIKLVLNPYNEDDLDLYSG